jgi:hypothetical protein
MRALLLQQSVHALVLLALLYSLYALYCSNHTLYRVSRRFRYLHTPQILASSHSLTLNPILSPHSSTPYTKGRFMSPSDTLDICSDWGVTFSAAVPTVWQTVRAVTAAVLLQLLPCYCNCCSCCLTTASSAAMLLPVLLSPPHLYCHFFLISHPLLPLLPYPPPHQIRQAIVKDPSHVEKIKLQKIVCGGSAPPNEMMKWYVWGGRVYNRMHEQCYVIDT